MKLILSFPVLPCQLLTLGTGIRNFTMSSPQLDCSVSRSWRLCHYPVQPGCFTQRPTKAGESHTSPRLRVLSPLSSNIRTLSQHPLGRGDGNGPRKGQTPFTLTVQATVLGSPPRTMPVTEGRGVCSSRGRPHHPVAVSVTSVSPK